MSDFDTFLNDNERFKVFVNSISKEEKSFIYELRDYAIKSNVPIIRDETKDFIKMLLNIYNPNNILELGTAIGYSTLIFSTFSNENTKIDTVENYKQRIELAKNNFELYDKNNKITLIESDISDFLKYNEKIYDLIFLDAAKAQYVVWLPYILKIMKKGSLLIADNILEDGDILDTRYNIKKRNRTIHKRMRDFLYQINHIEDLSTYLFKIGDGLSVSIKK